MDRLQLALECLEIEKAGGSVREYLRECGCISPWGTWHRLQKEELGRNEYQITDGKGGEDMNKITLEQKKKAVEIALNGGNPLPYLKECGSKTPDKLWYVIKKNLEQVDPEKFNRLPARVNAKKEEEQPPVTTCCARSTREGVEVPDELPEEVPEKPEVRLTADFEDLSEEPADLHRVTAVVLDDDFEIYGLKTKAGDFQAAAGNLCWTFDGFQMNLPVERWRQLIETVPKVLNMMKL